MRLVYGVTGCRHGAFYEEKNGYHQTHIRPEKKGMDGLHEKIIREIERTVQLNFKLNPPNTVPKDKLLLDTETSSREFPILALLCSTGLVS